MIEARGVWAETLFGVLKWLFEPVLHDGIVVMDAELLSQGGLNHSPLVRGRTPPIDSS